MTLFRRISLRIESKDTGAMKIDMPTPSSCPLGICDGSGLVELESFYQKFVRCDCTFLR